MNAPELLELMEGRGAHVEAHGDQLTIEAPRGALSDLVGDIALFKPALLELLEHRDSAPIIRQRSADEDNYQPPTGPDHEFRVWHWRACDAPCAFGFYEDWKQLARVHCGKATPHDVATIARAVLNKRQLKSDGPWRVASYVSGRELDSSTARTWAQTILEEGQQ